MMTVSALGSVTAGAFEQKSYAEDVSVYVNGQKIDNGQYKPIIANDRTLLRLVPIFEALGYSNSYESNAKTVTFARDGGTVSYKFTAENYTVETISDGQAESTYELDVPATLQYSDVFYVPLRAFCDMVGLNITWDNATRSVYVENALLTYEKAKEKTADFVNDSDIFLGGDTATVEHNGRQAYAFVLRSKELVENGGSGTMGTTIYVYADNGEVDGIKGNSTDNANSNNKVVQGEYKCYVSNDKTQECVGKCVISNVTGNAFDAKVSYARSQGVGYNIKIAYLQNDGTYSYYGHMQSRSSYGVGSRVNAGDIIGYVGKTGTASGYHLHFEWSWHDPYCEYSSKGYVYTCPNSGASVYPHTHANTTATTNNNNNGAYTAYAVNTDGSLAINSTNAAGHQIGSIPEGASCTVYPNRSVGNWRWVEYNGVSGYSYYKYLTTNKPNSGSNSISFSVSATGTSSTNTWTGTVRGTDGSLVINSKPKVGNDIGYIPEGATCTVYPDKTSGNWYWVEYNGIRGYSYKSYIVQNSSSSSNTRKGIIRGTDGSLVINSKPKVGNDIGYIPEGATCTVYPDKTSGNWYWVEYNGISGYSYKSYIVLQ